MALEELEKEIYKQEPLFRKKPEAAASSAKETEGDETAEDILKKNWEQARLASFKEKKPFRESLLGKFFSIISGKMGSDYGKILKYRRYGRWLFLGVVSAIVILLAVGGFYIYQYFSARDVIFSLEAPGTAMIGAPFDLKVRLDNQGENVLQKVKLTVVAPEGTLVLAESQEKQGIIVQELGNLEKGGSLQRKIPLIIFGNEQTIKRFRVSFSYLPSGLGGRLEKAKELDIRVGEPAIKLDLTTPEKVLNNEEFEVLARYSNVSDVDFYDAKILFAFPPNFVFKSSEPKITGQKSLLISDLAKNAGGEIRIKGKIIAEEGEFFEIKSGAELSFLNQPYKINEKAAKVLVASSPLSLKIAVNGKRADYVSLPEDDLRYELVFLNNTEAGLQDVVVKARLVGEMFDFSSLESDGFFSSLDNTIIWNAANTPELRLIAPNSGGEVGFKIKTRGNYPIRKRSDKNYTLKIQAEVSSPTVPYYVSAEKSLGVSSLENKVAGAITIEPKIYFNEPNKEIVNQGSLPPKVNSPTDFTVHWLIRNYATDVREIKISAFLQSSVQWTGAVKSNIGSLPTYNERTQEVSWLIDKIAAAKGVVDQPIEAVFQIKATPNITQVGSEMSLLGKTNIEAIDEFAGVKLTNAGEELKISSLEDAEANSKNIRVIQ